MDILTLICSIVAALTGVASLYITVLTRKDSKRSLIDKITKKREQIQDIDNHLFRRFGASYSGGGPMNSLEIQKRELQSEVDYLRKLI